MLTKRTRGSGIEISDLWISVIHQKVGPALKHSAKGIKNYPKIEVQSSKLKARQSLLT